MRIGLLLLESKQYQNALVTFKEVLRLRICVLGTQHRLVANVYNNMGLCCVHLGNFEEARDYLELATKIQRNIVIQDKHIQDMLELADTLFNLGGLNLEWIRREGVDRAKAIDAEQKFAEALQIRTHILGPDDKMVLQVKTLLDLAKGVPPQPTKLPAKSSFETDSTSLDRNYSLRTNNSIGSGLHHDRGSGLHKPMSHVAAKRDRGGNQGDVLSRHASHSSHHEQCSVSPASQDSVDYNAEPSVRIQTSAPTPQRQHQPDTLATTEALARKESERKKQLYSLLVTLVEQDRELREQDRKLGPQDSTIHNWW
jgi:tetratricopeptide (TPR) repeat protein